MNLRWNGRFEAEFSSDFQGDLAAVKAAGFKSDTSTGTWVWWTAKASVLAKLREKRPASGLTITADAKANYAPLAELEARNAKIKAEVAQQNKSQKKKRKIEVQISNAVVMPEKGYIEASDLPPMPPNPKKYVPPPPPDTLCIICGAPVYFYELQSPPTCLWDEKLVLDFSNEVC